MYGTGEVWKRTRFTDAVSWPRKDAARAAPVGNSLLVKTALLSQATQVVGSKTEQKLTDNTVANIAMTNR